MDRQRREKRHLATPDDTRISPKKRHKVCYEQQGRQHARKRTRRAVPEPVDLYSFKVPDRSSPNPPRSKSKDGHFRFVNGDNIGSRYKILNMIGEGTFGRVLECWDRQTRTIVAVKVIRSVPKYRDAAMIELEVLSTITANDPDKQHCCIHLQHWFDYRGHVCIVFEKLGMSLYDFMHKNAFRPFPLDIVQHFARQMLHALVFLHSLSVVHTDLKPENMLLTSSEHTKLDKEKHSKLGCRVPVSTDMRVIDFGSATFEEDRHSTVVSTRHYRAPEVILGLGWSYQCDIWSAGCIIVELITGRALFQTHDNLEHLAMMERVLEKVPQDMSRRASTEASKYFKDDMLLWNASASRKSIKAVQQLTSLRRLLRFEADSSATPHLDSLYGLLKEMLCFRPGQRSSARSCLEHDFFRENIRSLLPRRDDSSEQRRSGSKEQEGAVVQQRISHASRATSESCPVACIPKGAHKRNVSTAGEGSSGVKRRPVVVIEQNAGEELDAPAESDSVRNHQPHVMVRQDVSECEHGAAVLDSHAAAKMELRPDTEHSGAEMLAAAAQHGAKMRGSDTAAPSLKSSGSFWHDATVSQDSAPRDEAAKQDARQDNVKVSCIGGAYAAGDDDTRTSDLAENVSWPHRF